MKFFRACNLFFLQIKIETLDLHKTSFDFHILYDGMWGCFGHAMVLFLRNVFFLGGGGLSCS